MEVTQLRAGISPEHTDRAKPLLQFLICWLAYHILGSDKGMAKQLAAIEAGHSAEVAYLAEERSKDSAVEPLVNALSGLFQQVSERNRELFQLNQTLEARVVERTRELALANEQLEEIALTDVLTGLPNRRHALRRLTQAWLESDTDRLPLACMLIDADGFKRVNDTHGHDAGDRVLREVARNLRYGVRTDDVVCRLGGDEFLVICPGTPKEGALLLAEKLRASMEELCVPVGNGEWRGSISIGCAVRKEGMDSIDALMKAADEGVYAAKRRGRNCVAASD